MVYRKLLVADARGCVFRCQLLSVFVWMQFGCGACAGAMHCCRRHRHHVLTELLRFNPHGPLSLVFDGQPRTRILCGLHLVRRQWSLWVCTMVVGLLLFLRATWPRHDGRMAAA